MRKRYKAIFPALCLALIIGGSLLVYLNFKDGGIERQRASSQACESVRRDAGGSLGQTGRAAPDAVLAECGREQK